MISVPFALLDLLRARLGPGGVAYPPTAAPSVRRWLERLPVERKLLLLTLLTSSVALADRQADRSTSLADY